MPLQILVESCMDCISKKHLVGTWQCVYHPQYNWISDRRGCIPLSNQPWMRDHPYGYVECGSHTWRCNNPAECNAVAQHLTEPNRTDLKAHLSGIGLAVLQSGISNKRQLPQICDPWWITSHLRKAKFRSVCITSYSTARNMRELSNYTATTSHGKERQVVAVAIVLVKSLGKCAHSMRISKFLPEKLVRWWILLSRTLNDSVHSHHFYCKETPILSFVLLRYSHGQPYWTILELHSFFNDILFYSAWFSFSLRGSSWINDAHQIFSFELSNCPKKLGKNNRTRHLRDSKCFHKAQNKFLVFLLWFFGPLGGSSSALFFTWSLRWTISVARSRITFCQNHSAFLWHHPIGCLDWNSTEHASRWRSFDQVRRLAVLSRAYPQIPLFISYSENR